jgi:hypothetical protein
VTFVLSEKEPKTVGSPSEFGDNIDKLERNISFLKAILFDDPERGSSIAAAPALMVKEFVEFLHANRLRVFLPVILSDKSVSQKLSGKELGRLERYVKIQRKRRGVLEELLTSCGSIMRESGIEFLVLKGAHYSERFFPAPFSRPFDDIDILVRQGRFEAANKALRSCGFRQIDNRPLLEPIIRRFEHSITLERCGAKLDLHWHLRNRPSYELDMDRIWQQQQSLQLQSGSYPVLSDEYAVTMSILEAAHSIEQGGLRLKVFVDLFQILKTVSCEINWDEFMGMRQRENILTISVNVLYVLNQLFECEREYPELSTVLVRYQNLLVVTQRNQILRLVQAPRSNTQNRSWYSQCYNGNTRLYAGWTVMSFLFGRRTRLSLPSLSSLTYILSSLFNTTRKKSKS